MVRSHDKLSGTGMASGWGLAYNPSDGMLYGTDGGKHIYTFSPEDFKAAKKFSAV